MSAKYFGFFDVTDIAADAYLQKRPSIAAATVPEYITSSPIFSPKLIPEKTILGKFFKKPQENTRRSNCISRNMLKPAETPGDSVAFRGTSCNLREAYPHFPGF